MKLGVAVNCASNILEEVQKPTPARPSQNDFLTCYRERQSALYHLAYMRMGKVLLALHLCHRAGINLADKSIFDYGFGAGTFFRYCPRSSHLFGVEIDPVNVSAVQATLQSAGFSHLDLQPIDPSHWAEHPLLDRVYDLILCSHVLEHLPEPAVFLKRMRQCLGNDSLFIGLVPLNERSVDPHHLHAVNRTILDSWVEAAGLTVSCYLEADPWLYWVQPIFASRNRAVRMLAQGTSLGLGIVAASAGSERWTKVGHTFGRLTRSRPTQAAFILKRVAAGE